MANQIIVNAKAEKSTISKMIYGHFAEHLGRCIYDGSVSYTHLTLPTKRIV